MWTKHFTLILILILAGVGLVSAWNFASSKPSDTKEGFVEHSTDEDIDYFVAVSSALKKVNKTESSAKEVRRVVADMRSKNVKLKDAEHFVRTSGGRVAVTEHLEVDSGDKDTHPKVDEIPKQNMDIDIDEEPDSKNNTNQVNSRSVEKSSETFRVADTSKTSNNVSESGIGSLIAVKITRELNDIADRIDELVEQIYKLNNPVKGKSTTPPVSTTEGFTPFPSWAAV